MASKAKIVITPESGQTKKLFGREVDPILTCYSATDAFNGETAVIGRH